MACIEITGQSIGDKCIEQFTTRFNSINIESILLLLSLFNSFFFVGLAGPHRDRMGCVELVCVCVDIKIPKRNQHSNTVYHRARYRAVH